MTPATLQQLQGIVDLQLMYYQYKPTLGKHTAKVAFVTVCVILCYLEVIYVQAAVVLGVL